MLHNFIVTAFRSFSRNKIYSIINILGLSLGIAVCLLIALFIQKELSYDRYFDDYNNICRIEFAYKQGEIEGQWASTTGDILPALQNRYPECSNAVKINQMHFPIMLTYEEKKFVEHSVCYADSTFFDVFSLKLLQGDKNTALAEPSTVVLTESTAMRYFGETNVVGKVLESPGGPVKVSGVMQDIPEETHFHFDIFISLNSLRQRWPGVDQTGPSVFYSYIRFNNRNDLEKIREQANKDIYILTGQPEPDEETKKNSSQTLVFNPLKKIHLTGHSEKEIEPNGNLYFIYIFGSVAILVLLIALLNYINLSTAQSTKRAREVGIRKVFSAEKKDIFTQFLVESVIIVAFALIISIALVELALPMFNKMLQQNITLEFLTNWQFLSIFGFLILMTGFLAGFYPAVVLSQFNPLHVLKLGSQGSVKSSRGFLRKALVILQFSISGFLIIGSSIMFMQLRYIESKDLGFQKENIVLLPYTHRSFDALKTELLSKSEIKSVSGISTVPGERVPVLSARMEYLRQQALQQGQEAQGIFAIRTLSGDIDMLETLKLEVIDGRGFSREYPNDPNNAFILNEAAVKALELENPVGMDFEYTYNLPEPKVGKIIGVVKDFHYASIHNTVDPLLIHVFPHYNKSTVIRFESANPGKTVREIEATWKEVVPQVPFEFEFLDVKYDALYKKEMNMGKIIAFFTLLTIVISAMGLIGLTSFTTRQRTKEVAIRKVFGAEISNIILMFTKEFFILITIANAIAVYPTYRLTKWWLSEFAFHIDINAVVFVAGFAATYIIGLTTVYLMVQKASRTNAAEALQYE